MATKSKKGGKGKKAAATKAASPVKDRTPIQGTPEPAVQHQLILNPKQAEQPLPTRKTDTLVQDFAPAGLLNTRAFARTKLAEAADRGEKTSLLYLHVRTPKGGSEFRPMGLFTKLPAVASGYVCTAETAKRPSYTYVGELHF